jgi:ribosomal protein S6
MDYIEQDKKEYEISFLLKDEAGISALQNVLARFECSVISQSEIRRIVLAYPIKKETSALFGYAYVLMAPSQVQEISHELRLEGGILRFLVIADPIKHLLNAPTEVAPQSSSTDERPARVVTNEDLEKKLEEILT